MIRVEHLSKAFSGLKAVSNVTFEIQKDEISGIIGPNGAGKTTIFNMISGFLKPTAGRVFYGGRDITDMKVHERVEIGIARTFQIMKPLSNMTVLDNVIAGAFFGRNKCRHYDEAKRHALEVLEFTNLIQKKDFSAKELGTSDKKRLELTRALVARPDLLLLDEVMAGLNPTETDECADLIRKVNQSGITVFLIEHVMRAVVNLCEYIIVLHHGEKIADGVPSVVMNDRMVMEVYLGKDDTYAQG